MSFNCFTQRILLFTPLFLFTPFFAAAHVPVFPEIETVSDVVEIADPEYSQVFYGELVGFPHTFEIETSEPFVLHAEILQPDISSSERNISGIIIKELAGGGRVTEVARLSAKDASWEPFFEFFGGDTYLAGPSFEETVEAGTYRIEVSTPDNIGKYALSVGTEEVFAGVGPLELIRRIAGVKVFFDKSQFRIVESPLVYVPIFLFVLVSVVFFYVRNRKRSHV